MIRIPGKIPVIIHPTFWLFAALIGYMNSLNLIGTVVWVVIIFTSILVHEYGHALTALLFGKRPRIELVALGGLTYHGGENLPFWKQFLIVLNGPLFGFFLYIFATFLLSVTSISNGPLAGFIATFRFVNLFWTIVNLLPVLPLDGGQLLRIILESIFGSRGVKYTLGVSSLVAFVLSLCFFFYQAFLVGALFFLFAFQAYESFRKARVFVESGSASSTTKKRFQNAEEFMQKGKNEEAIEAFEAIRNEVKKGAFYLLATEKLAFLKRDAGKKREAYQLLLPLKDQLSNHALFLLHTLSFEEKNYPLVLELGSSCFQQSSSVEVALRNALASACLKKTAACIGWLETALQGGIANLTEILEDSNFDLIREEPAFQAFSKRL